MSPELKYLLFSVLLCFAQVVVQAIAATGQVGLVPLAGNREGLGELTGLAGRAKRAHLNMVENLVLFAALVLIAVVAQKTSPLTAMGAMLFFWSRVVFAIVYLVGIPWLRTAVWAVSVVAMAMIAWSLLGAL
jgi:uncharacterized MAPEG superfamily protein